jgi:hypothetical protein
MATKKKSTTEKKSKKKTSNKVESISEVPKIEIISSSNQESAKTESEFISKENSVLNINMKSNSQKNEKPKNEIVIDIQKITEAIGDTKLQADVLSIHNENSELKANLEKASKMIRILKKKLDLVEEKEEQWRICAHSLGEIFAEKSHMPLEDVLRKFDAPLDEAALTDY